MKKIVMNMLIIISLIVMIVSSVYFEINREIFYKIEINNILRVILIIITILLLIIYNVKKVGNKIKNTLIMLFVIFSLIIPIYKTGRLYAPTGPHSIYAGVAIEIEYLNIYGIKIFDKK